MSYEPPPQINEFDWRWRKWINGLWALFNRQIKTVAVDDLGNVVTSQAALATNATDGFLYIPTCAGTPTGTPTAKTGTVPIVFDTVANKIYVYDGAWIGTSALS